MKKNENFIFEEKENVFSDDDEIDYVTVIIVILCYFFLILTFPFSLIFCLKVGFEYHRLLTFNCN